ncbi:hypothetical protein EIP91_008293 [Steccherinum ochraceum]|uniref:Uncharacterized protein n=1 Tax=Steccherinum ochraceum TaxID=92696 RepID=A0A4R0R316_9APHY|nr:hypothetical protein EIP91_008293 [Steccherinum ochraceum]
MFLTFRSHVDELWCYIDAIETRPGELKPKSDELWSTLEKRHSTSAVPATGHSCLLETSLYHRTLFLMSQISRRDQWVLSDNVAQLRDVIAHYCQLGSSAKEHIVMCLVAFATSLGYELEGDASLGITTIQLEQQVNASAVHAIDAITRYTQEIGFHDDDVCHFVDSGVPVFKANIRHLQSLRTPNILGCLLKLCASIHDKFAGLQEDAVPRWTRALAGLLRLVLHAASTTEFPHHLASVGWKPDPSNLKWLPAFLRTLCSLSGKQSGSLGEEEIQHAAVDAFLLLARGGGIGPTGEDVVLAAFDWVITLPVPAERFSDTDRTSIFRLQVTMIHMVDTALQGLGYSSDFTTKLRTHIISSLSILVAQPARSLSESDTENSKVIYERDKAFIATLLSLTPESSARETWLNDPTNDACGRTRTGELSTVSLLACTSLCQATAAYWGDDLACVQRVAVVAVWREWDMWYATEKVSEDQDALVERTRTVMEVDAQSAVDVEWYIDDTCDTMEFIQRTDPEQAQQLQLPAMISALRQKLIDIKELMNRAEDQISQRPEPNSESLERTDEL